MKTKDKCALREHLSSSFEQLEREGLRQNLFDMADGEPRKGVRKVLRHFITQNYHAHSADAGVADLVVGKRCDNCSDSGMRPELEEMIERGLKRLEARQ